MESTATLSHTPDEQEPDAAGKPADNGIAHDSPTPDAPSPTQEADPEDPPQAEAPLARGRHFYRRLCAFLLVAALIVLAALFGLGVFNPPAPPAPAPELAAPTPQNGPVPELAAPAPQNGNLPAVPQTLPFEEPIAMPLELGIKQADYALLEALRSMGIDNKLEVIYVLPAASGFGQYTYQRLALYLPVAGAPRPEEIFAALAKSLAQLAPEAELDSPEAGLLRIRLHGLTTHEIRLASPLAPRPTGPQGDRPPRLAIIIDDMGESPRAANSLLALDYPVTFSIWPDSTHARAIAETAHKSGREVMIHQPMEPLGYPEVKPGPNALYLGQSREKITQTVAASIHKVPHAVGLNNHMGSRITQDPKSMEAVLDALLATRGSHPLFVLDSVTHPSSRLYALSRQLGLRSYRRDIFLDVQEDVGYILHQLDKAAQIARQNGQAIAIGHPLPETLEALKQWQTKRDPGVLIVPLANLN